MSRKLRALLSEVDAVLLDFDGPVCSVFAGYPAHVVAADLVQALGKAGVATAAIESEPDPIEVLRWVAREDDEELTAAADQALTAAEVRAVATAEPTPFSHDLIAAINRLNMPLVVVSNNSSACISAYLVAHGCNDMVRAVEGRPFADPGRMKPNPAVVLAAIADLGVTADRCVLIGDSPSDMVAAASAGARRVGYANREGKHSSLVEAGAEVIAASMGNILDAFEQPDPTRGGP